MSKVVRPAVLVGLGLAVTLWFCGPAVAETCGCMDVALVIDDTGSMGGALDNVKTGLDSIITTAQTASGNDLRMSLVSFPEDFPIVRQTMTTNLTDETNAVNALTPTDGGNEPEASDESLRLVVTGTSNCTTEGGSPGTFRSECLKIAILVTDARPGGCDDAYTPGVDDVNAAQVASLAASAGIKISAVYVPTSDEYTSTIVPIMQTYATTSGGQYSLVNSDGTGTADAINNIIASCGGPVQQAAPAPTLSWPLLAASLVSLLTWGVWRLGHTSRQV